MLLGCLSVDHDGMLNFDIYFYLHRSNLLEINLFYDKLYYLWVRQIPKYERIGDVLGIIYFFLKKKMFKVMNIMLRHTSSCNQ